MAVSRLFDEESRVPVTTLGRSGARVPRLVLGTQAWSTASALEATTVEKIVSAYLDAGGFALDVTDADGGENAERVSALLGPLVARDETFLIGHCGRGPQTRVLPGTLGDTSRRGLMSALDALLSRLRTEHLDLWVIDGFDGVTPVEEIASTLEWAVSSGRATYVGVRGVAAWQAVDLSHALAARNLTLSAHEVEYSLLERSAEADGVPAAASRGYGVLGGAPLAGGVLSGKYRHSTPADSRRAGGVVTMPSRHFGTHARSVVESLATAADGLGVNPAEVALAWALRADGVDALVIGARTTAQLKVLLRADALDLPHEIMAVLDEVSAPRG